MKKTALLLFLILYSFTAFSLDRKVVIEEAPFIPCVECNLTVFNPCRLSSQITGVGKGETVHLLAWDKRAQNLLVELEDGSRGYMPAIAFIKGGVILNVSPNTYKAQPRPSKEEDYNGLRFNLMLPASLYQIFDAGFWNIGDDGFQPYFMDAVDKMTGKQYLVSNRYDAPSYRHIRFRDFSDEEMRALPFEKHLEKTLFFDDEKKHSIQTYIGYTEQELVSILGEPDAIIAASRSKERKTELFYRNVCYDGSTWEKKGSLNKGVVFYMSNGKVAKAAIDSYFNGPKSSMKYTTLPAGKYEKPEAKPTHKPRIKRRALPDIDWSQVTPWNILYHFLHQKVSTNFLVISVVIALLCALVCLLWWLVVKKLLNFGPDGLVRAMYLIPIVAFSAYVIYNLWLFSWIYGILIGLYSVVGVGGTVGNFFLEGGLMNRCQTCHCYNDFEEIERIPTEQKVVDKPQPTGKEYPVDSSYGEVSYGSESISTVVKEYNQRTTVEYRQYYDVLERCRRCGTERHITSSELIATLPGPIIYKRVVDRTHHYEEDEVTMRTTYDHYGNVIDEREVDRTTYTRSRAAGGYDYTSNDAEVYNVYLQRYLDGDKDALNEYYEERMGNVRL